MKPRASGATLMLPRAGMALATALLASSLGSARADDSASRTAKKHAATTIAPANATLHVTPAALGTSWTFEITNADTTPLRVVTDGRLLTLDVTPEDDDSDHPNPHPRVVHCALPAEVRPTTDAEHAQTIAPGETFVVEFDPRLYCFDGKGLAALVPGSHVTARLGWPTPRSQHLSPPFIADETFAHATRSGVKELVAESVVTPDVLPTDESSERAKRLVVTAPARIDSETGRNLQIDLTVENTTSRPVHLMLRPETLAFEVASPRGVHGCTWSRRSGTAIPEVFTTIAPHAKASTGVLLAAVCPEGTFSEAGLYTVFPRLDTRHASGKAIGIDTFEGVVATDEPTLVRVRRARAPRP